MIDEVKSYETVEPLLREEFATKPDRKIGIENELLLKIWPGQSASEVPVIFQKGYNEAGSRRSRNIFVSNVVVIDEEIQNFVVLPALTTFQKL